MTKTHWLLCGSEDFAAARAQVRSFLSRSLLLRYDHLSIAAAAACSAAEARFWSQIEAGIRENRRLIDGFLAELRTEGCSTIDDLAALGQGYPSKLLHIVAHLLDGFIGIDSVFYNLVDDSHWLPAKTAELIRSAPTSYWLLRVEASFESAAGASLIHRMGHR